MCAPNTMIGILSYWILHDILFWHKLLIGITSWEVSMTHEFDVFQSIFVNLKHIIADGFKSWYGLLWTWCWLLTCQHLTFESGHHTTFVLGLRCFQCKWKYFSKYVVSKKQEIQGYPLPLVIYLCWKFPDRNACSLHEAEL